MTALMFGVVGGMLLFALLVFISVYRLLFGSRVAKHGGAR